VRRGKYLATAALAGAVGCGIGIGRDLSQMTPQAVIYDDVCKVQDYFDAVAIGQDKPLTVVSTSEVSKNENALGGITTFAFESDPHLRLVRRVLTENWSKLPEKLTKAQRLELRVKWAEKAGVRRVVTTEDAQITFDGTSTFLPYHICLSELLFGAPLYRTRRDLLGLPPLAPPPDAAPAPSPDAGAAADAQAVH
jgi:hypothetical protein